MDLPTQLNYPLIAVGDLHGQTDLLDDLLGKLRKRRVWKTATVVFLGDFCDRGPDTKGCLERVLGLVREGKAAAVMGNHDLALVRGCGLDGRAPSPWWRGRYLSCYQSATTFRSYLGRPACVSRGVADARLLARAMPEAHKDFLASLPWLAEADGHVFLHCGLSRNVHAGAAVQLTQLRQRRWLRSMARCATFDFLPHDEYPAWLGADRDASYDPLPCPGKVQVTGHVLTDAPDADAVRIRIDTTGGTFSPLTAALLEGPGCTPVYVQGGPPYRPVKRAFSAPSYREPTDWARGLPYDFGRKDWY